MMNEDELIQKLGRIEALFAGAKTEGEKNASVHALERIQKKLSDLQVDDPAVEYKFSMTNHWSKKLFIALLRRYGLKPYRYRRQRHTTVMVKISKSFVDETLWPEFTELDKTLNSYLESITSRIISESIFTDSEEMVLKEPKYLN
ncbi:MULTISPECIES: hypothetical protein [unclassified Oceanispirochaeta]|nr:MULTISPECIES: hypothetical protein [unclassified Oceanispirochaeta]MBF9015967.1 hypothetical protein [Oceanispirochaeta sp. M2]NPD72430.1 hypothetical protein [Oceanispirochaeta sp. M1]RDG32212.1 hypothetical protein DV872_09980 [Oceanispirochaeta sp. M1]